MFDKIKSLTKEKLFRFLCSISDQYQTGVAMINLEHPDYPIVYTNKAFSILTGYEEHELIGKTISSFNGIKTDAEIDMEIRYHFSTKSPFELNILHYQKDGSALWNSITCQPIQGDDGERTFAIVHCKDITEQMLSKMLSKLEHEVYLELEKSGELNTILQLITEKVEKYYIRDIYCAIHVLQPDYQLKALASGSLPLAVIDSINDIEISTVTAYNQSAVYIKNLALSDSFKKYNLTSCWSKPIFNKEKQLLGYFSIYIKDYFELKSADLEFLKKLSPIIALSMKYVEQQQELKQLAYIDMSTGIPNFNYFHNTLTQWVEKNIEGSILLIQPSEYSSIVDLYGRKIGDELIRQLINRIEPFINNKNQVIYGRFSNSSFILAVTLPEYELDQFISQLLQVTAAPIPIANREIFITLKIGISPFDNTMSIDESVRRADTALTKARYQKGAVVSFFEAETDGEIQRELDILNQLRFGIQNEEFTVHLQPKVNLMTAEIEGFEALARWYSPVLGNVSPAEFIKVAEQAGKIRELDNIILKKVLQFQNERQMKGLKMVPIAVNISPVHFYHESFVNDFITLVNQYNVSSQFIKIEVTESVELFDFQKAKEILLELKQFGYESSIDDFGVGFSSLSYLQQLPFSEIKIDRSFINDINDSGMYAVVQTIVQLASNLNMHAVAEGIETLEQFVLLQKMGCRTGQGYYFHKPMSFEDAKKLLNSIK
ncbi:EAL domain-containing protein [Lysinibacillus telephonicus]|uniref:EAL domain-containing protein n=1 Tax=Lysinibacillus telephonicus TaxID=1714840 RepID=UPI0031FDB861